MKQEVESKNPDEKFPPEQTLPVSLIKRLLVIAACAGLVGGFVGGWVLISYGGKLIPAGKRVLTESSDVIEVAKKVSPSVVSITSQTLGFDFFGYSRKQEGAGTGIIVTADGLILTNKHVVEGAQTFSVFTSDGKEYKNAQVVAKDPSGDIAYLKISATNLTPAELGDSSAVVVGQKVVAIGNALGQFQNTVTTGVISGLGRPLVAGNSDGTTEQLQDLFQTDAAINPGNSGGPLVDMTGYVIGINTAVAGGGENIGFAIPINEAKSSIDTLKSTGKIIRPYLGVRYIPITRDFAARNNLSVTSGAYVTGSGRDLAVIPSSPAAKAGIKEGDIITHIGEDRIDDKHSLSSLVGKHKVGEKLTITILRDGKEQKLEATLEEVPAN